MGRVVDQQFDAGLGLYWQVPVWDAMEFTASSYQSADPTTAATGFRPDAQRVPVRRRHGDRALLRARPVTPGRAAEYENDARSLRTAMEKWLWDPDAASTST